MNLEIRPAVKQDMKDVWTLIEELAIYEKEPNAVEISIKDLINHKYILLGKGKKTNFILRLEA